MNGISFSATLTRRDFLSRRLGARLVPSKLEVEFISREMKVNDQIRARQVRFIDSGGQQQGILDTKDALSRAREEGLDLVLVGENSQPPVARMMDYGKYRYEIQQQAKEARKRAKNQEMKSIKFRIKIEEHDYTTKVNHIKRFLKSGHKVKVVIMFRGRERTHPELGKEILNRVSKDVGEIAAIDSPPTLAGMDMTMTLRSVTGRVSPDKEPDSE